MTEEHAEIGIGGRVKAARERAELSREALAFHSGISWSAIVQIESGRRTNLRPTTVAALASTLGVTMDYLVSGRSPSGVMLEHRALLYQDEDEFLAGATPFLTQAVDRSEAALAVTDRTKIQALRDQLGQQADWVHFADQEEWYGSPARALGACREFVNAWTGTGAPWVRILGEPVWRGRSAGDVRAWTRYESLLNLVFGASPVTILCPYGTQTCDGTVLEQARATHPYTLEQGTLSPSLTYCNPAAYLLEQPDG